ncbi:MAG: hypothetical protein WAS90_10705 [Brachymonas denitrificans]|jgi:hypothetical protein|uniref:hypothetical protein n=1 Tax=Brachymonas denitrificans TaxID=28220 RepID=UPI0032209F23
MVSVSAAGVVRRRLVLVGAGDSTDALAVAVLAVLLRLVTGVAASVASAAVTVLSFFLVTMDNPSTSFK